MSEKTKDVALAHLANDMIELRSRMIETGKTAAQVIARNQPEVFELLRDAFSSDEAEIAGWLTHTLVLYRKSPLEMLVEGNTDEVRRVLGSIIHGLPA